MSSRMHHYFTSHRILTAFLSGSNTKSTCVGTCTEGPRKGGRCWQQLTKKDWDEGLEILSQLDERDHDSASVKEELTRVAEKLLCARHHQNQKQDVAEERSDLRETKELLLQSAPSRKRGSKANKARTRRLRSEFDKDPEVTSTVILSTVALQARFRVNEAPGGRGRG